MAAPTGAPAGVRRIEIRNAELMGELTDRCARLGITDAAVVSLIGAVDAFSVSTVRAHDATESAVDDHDLAAEMTGTGEIVGGVPHLHVVMAVEGGRTFAGHLRSARVGTWFAHVYVQPVA